MAQRITKAYLEAQLGILSKLLGWDCTSDIWTDGKACVGRVFIESGSRINGRWWHITMINNDTGGEARIASEETARHMSILIDGMIKSAAEMNANIKGESHAGV